MFLTPTFPFCNLSASCLKIGESQQAHFLLPAEIGFLSGRHNGVCLVKMANSLANHYVALHRIIFPPQSTTIICIAVSLFEQWAFLHSPFPGMGLSVPMRNYSLGFVVFAEFGKIFSKAILL